MKNFKLNSSYLTKFIASNFMLVIGVAIIISMMLIASVGWNVWNMHSDFKTVVSTEFQLQSLSGKIIHLDEVLTMSARVAASTGDLEWEKRYKKFEPELDAAIKKVIQIAPEVQAANASETDAANIKLVQMEQQAFELVRKNKSQEALNLLNSQNYNTQKQIYANGMTKTTTALNTRIQSNLESYRQRLFLSSLFCIISFPILTLAWLAVFGLVKWYITQRQRAENALHFAKAELEQVNTTLETKVEERTFELEAANVKIVGLNESLNKENVRMKTELDLTRQVQQTILPKQEELAQIKNLDIVGFMQPATEIGGDYYDIISHDGKVKIGIGDVTGHGLESGMLMLMVQTAVRTLLENNETNPQKFLNTLNRAIYNNVQRMESDKNMTLCLLDYNNGKVRVYGQHEEVIIIRRGGMLQRIDTTDLGFAIGLEEEISHLVAYADIQLLPDDVIVLYTDGITEAEDINGALYGLKRLIQVIKENWQLCAEEIKQAIIQDLWEFIGAKQLLDDVTLVVLKQK
ncbi:putative PP2C-type protein phosphatase [Rivularia sp. IAM M-261]|nr:putative PP2C-type protein phosphatase [Calothrix sp. PCC 7716]GJD18419.1 putative PP2C-type protein phosphatase [Rivularia sp. IAM M-261]